MSRHVLRFCVPRSRHSPMLSFASFTLFSFVPLLAATRRPSLVVSCRLIILETFTLSSSHSLEPREFPTLFPLFQVTYGGLVIPNASVPLSPSPSLLVPLSIQHSWLLRRPPFSPPFPLYLTPSSAQWLSFGFSIRHWLPFSTSGWNRSNLRSIRKGYTRRERS